MADGGTTRNASSTCRIPVAARTPSGKYPDYGLSRPCEAVELSAIGTSVQTGAIVKTLLILLLMSAQMAFGQPTQIILFRHAEKPDNPAATHLSARGSERARLLAALLGKHSTLTSNAVVAALYATRATKHGNGLRTGETLAPLATELALAVQTPFESENYKLLARRVLTEPAYRGKTVIICWTHHEIAALAEALGVKPKPPRWQDEVFDRFWVIGINSGKATLRELPQGLLPGDAKQ